MPVAFDSRPDLSVLPLTLEALKVEQKKHMEYPWIESPDWLKTKQH